MRFKRPLFNQMMMNDSTFENLLQMGARFDSKRDGGREGTNRCIMIIEENEFQIQPKGGGELTETEMSTDYGVPGMGGWV